MEGGVEVLKQVLESRSMLLYLSLFYCTWLWLVCSFTSMNSEP